MASPYRKPGEVGAPSLAERVVRAIAGMGDVSGATWVIEMDAKKYSYMVRWSAEDQEYVATVCEFPRLSWLEKDPVSALEGMIKVVQEVLDDLVACKEEVPEPRGVPEMKDVKKLWEHLWPRCDKCNAPATRHATGKWVLGSCECCDKCEAPYEATYGEYKHAGVVRRLAHVVGREE